MTKFKFKIIFFIVIAISFCKASLFDVLNLKNKTSNYEKAFSATCAETADSFGYFTYSILVAVSDNLNLAGSARIIVNDLSFLIPFYLKNPKVYFLSDFNLQKGDEIVIEFEINGI